MTTDTWIQFAQLSTILVGSLGIAVAMRSHRRQINAQMFIEFSARFQHVLQTMPVDAWIPNGRQTLPARSEDLTMSSLQLFHLVANLFHLQKHGYISRDLWRPAQLAIKQMLQDQLFQREWFALEPAFHHTPDYCRYVRRIISDGEYARCRTLETTA
jgi:hypothetical protein